MIKRKIFFDDKKIVSFFLVYLLSFIPLNYYINVFLSDYLHSGLGVSALLYGLAVCFGVGSYFLCFKKSKLLGLFVILFLLFGTIFYLFLYPSNSSLVFTSFLDLAYNPFIILFAYCVPVFLIGLSGKIDYKKVFKIIVIIGRIVVIALIIFFFALNIGWKNSGGQYMTTSYYALPSICALMLSHAKKKRFVSIDGLLSLFGIFLIMVGGSRGALMCVALFALLLIFYSSFKLKQKIWLFVAFIILLTILIVGFNDLLALFKSFMRLLVFDSRTISKIEGSSFFVSNDRIQIWSNCIQAILQTPLAPFLGFGLWGDRPIANGYSHNIFVELITSFGFFFGTLFFLVICLKIIKGIIGSFKTTNEKSTLFLIAIPYGFFQLLFSDSFLLNVWFFLLIGLMFQNNSLTDRAECFYSRDRASNDILHTI